MSFMTEFRAIPLRKTTLVLAGLALTAFACPAFAEQRVVVEKNHTLRVALSAPAGSVIVGNPEIADVNVVDSRTIYIVGRGFGSSAVTVTGRDGKALFDGEVVVSGARQGAITVYKGLKPSLMVCANVCVAQDINDSNTPQGSAPALPAMPAAAAPTAAVSQ
jgi:Flp pilus assembly secretin CpaC